MLNTTIGTRHAAPGTPVALRRFTKLVAFSTLFLIFAGAMVTSTGSGLAVPDWPLSYGMLMPPMIAGIFYEHGHRMIAQFCGLLTVVFAVWAQLRDGRRWMRRLGWAMVALVVVQGALGGITVLMLLPWYVSTLHAIFAQTYFAAAVLLVLFTGQRWESSDLPKAPDRGAISLFALALAALGAVYCELFLGAAFRHGGMHFLPHIIGAIATTGFVLWAAIRALTGFSDIKSLRGMGIAIQVLLVTQLGLGFLAYLARVEWGRGAAQPLPLMVASTVAHVSVGALLLAHCLMLAVLAHRHAERDTAGAAVTEKIATA
jgi:cytochrome c oxidase assembly protein subunit 15